MSTDADLTSQAKSILRRNTRGEYTVPTNGLYPFQWNWDSMFVALGWAEFDEEMAWTEIEKLFDAQWASGMVPHIVFWTEESSYFPGPDVWSTGRVPPTSGISQPPVAASVVRRIADSQPDRAARLLPHLERWHRWWYEFRGVRELGVATITHPWESGRDNLPDWDLPLSVVDASGVGRYERRDTDLVDASMRPHDHEYDRYLALVQFGVANEWSDKECANSPFRVADPAITAILLRAETDLAFLIDAAGVDYEHLDSTCMTSAPISDRIKRLQDGYEQFWSTDASAYCSFDPRTGNHALAGTSASLLAPYAGIDSRLSEVVALLQRWRGQTGFVVPSFEPAAAEFEADRYWRGPIWLVVNYVIAEGLASCDAVDSAEMIRQSSLDLVRTSGFYESFNPLDGAGVGGADFSWTAAIWLRWINSPYVGRT